MDIHVLHVLIRCLLVLLLQVPEIPSPPKSYMQIVLIDTQLYKGHLKFTAIYKEIKQL